MDAKRKEDLQEQELTRAKDAVLVSSSFLSSYTTPVKGIYFYVFSMNSCHYYHYCINNNKLCVQVMILIRGSTIMNCLQLWQVVDSKLRILD